MRLFFAVWPDAAARARLDVLAGELARSTGGRATPADKIHLTLEFLGDVVESRVAELCAIAGRLRAPAFEMILDRVGSFRRARVAWVGMDGPPDGLTELHRQLARALEAAGFEREARPFSPHVTLARRTLKAATPRTIAAVAWPVAAVALVHSEPGTGRYTTLESWPLY